MLFFGKVKNETDSILPSGSGRAGDSEDAFSAYHPAVEFLFFFGAVVIGMFLSHPLFQGLSLLAAITYYLLLNRGSCRLLFGLLLLWPVLALMNAFLVQEGRTVLFTYWHGRVFTLEALLYGCSIGAVFISVILWFSCYDRIMTSDKFISLFGKMAPSLCLLLCMVLRLIPGFENRMKAVEGARRCIGKGMNNGNQRDKLEHSGIILSALTSWALEGAVVTADSMKSRGYGSETRTNFNIYRWTRKDAFAAAVFAVSLSAFLAGAFGGAASAEYYPVLDPGLMNALTYVSAAGYAVFLFTPSFLNVREDITWRILRSRI